MVLFFLFSCSMDFKYPATRLSGPEVMGANGKGIDITGTSAHKADNVVDLKATPVKLGNKTTQTEALNFIGAIGISDRMDIECQLGKDTPFMLGGKFRILGEPKSKAGDGDYSLAARIAYGFIVSGKTVKAYDGEERKFTISSTASDYELVAGYRLTGELLIFAGYFYSSYGVGGEFSTGPDTVLNTEGNQHGYHLGVGFSTSKRIQFKIDCSRVRNNYEGHLKKDYHFGGALSVAY